MSIKKKIAVGLCIGLAASLGVRALIAPSLAHTENTVSWQSTLQAADAPVVSNLLCKEGQTVLLGALAQGGRSLTIELTATEDTVSGTVTVEADAAVSATLDRTQLVLTKGSCQTLNLTLTRNTSAEADSEASDTACVRVTWMPEGGSEEDQLRAELQVSLTEEDATAELPALGEGATETRLISDYIPAYSEELPLWLSLQLGEETTSAWLLYNNGLFPAMTRYTIGDRTFLLYEEGWIDLSGADASLLQIDLSATELFTTEETHVILTLYAEDGETLHVQQISPYRLTQSSWLLPEGTKVLTTDTSLNILIQTLSCDCALTLSHLTTDGDGTLVWEDLEGSTFGIEAVLKEERQITLLLDDTKLPPAGTYRLSVDWIWNDTTVMQQTMEFFVQY